MILIADSGSTKTDWALVDNHHAVREIKTRGLNPFQVSEEEITEEIRSELLPHLPTSIVDAVHFYGAGCTPEKQPLVEQALRSALTVNGTCTVASDMLGAAIAVCGHEPGIACILGTGSNSCAYDGERIVKNVSPLGFILGDEGSGASMGKYLLGNILKRQWPEGIIRRFDEKYGLTAADIIERVYRQPRPNTFLASFMPFLEENLQEPVVYGFVKDNFRSFLRRNVRQYDGWDRLPIGFNGSIAQIYRKPLEEALAEEGMRLGRIVKAPMEGLVRWL
ncbi:MAG TPA: ATPase [Prevotella sp.]|nr:ATPase [Prevotella sp.]